MKNEHIMIVTVLLRKRSPRYRPPSSPILLPERSNMVSAYKKRCQQVMYDIDERGIKLQYYFVIH